MKSTFARSAVLAAVLGLGALLSACGGASGDAGGPAVAVFSPAQLSITDTRAGSGPEAVAGSRVQVNYTGWLYTTASADFKGRQFDASAPGQPFTFVVGAVAGTPGSVIAGFGQGVQGMKVGGKRTILIPSGLAYGTAGAPPVVPPNSGLVFEVELVKVCANSACT